MSMIDDTAAIEKAVMLCVDGATRNDNTLVKQAFDARARLFGGMMDGTRLDGASSCICDEVVERTRNIG